MKLNKNRKKYQPLPFAERNSVTQNLDFMLRSYDPRIGRFTTPDPFAQDFSPYSGMGNNPVAMVDPTGGRYVFWQWKAGRSGKD